MPLFLRFSLIPLLLSLVSGQLWLHDAASVRAVHVARTAVASCRAASPAGDLSSRWDVIRAGDRVYARRLAALAGLARPC